MDIYQWTAALERPISKDKQRAKNGFSRGLLDSFLGVYNSQ